MHATARLDECDSHDIGTASGGLYALQCPALQNYSNVRAHLRAVLSTAAVGDGVASLSEDTVRYHSSGGLSLSTFTAAQVCFAVSTISMPTV